MTAATGMGIGMASAGLIIIAVCVPLIWGKVPMNRLYGIRIAASFESNERWYVVNAYGGKVMARWALVVVAWGLAGWLVPSTYGLWYVEMSPLAVLLPMGVAIVWILIWARKRHSAEGGCGQAPR
jgi:hypothetical protein